MKTTISRTAKTTNSYLKFKTNVMYSCPIDSLTVSLGGTSVDVTKTLKSGRTNYDIFESILLNFLPLQRKIDGSYVVDGAGKKKKVKENYLVDGAGKKYQAKAFLDNKSHPEQDVDLFHTAASRTFGPNNAGPLVKKLVDIKDYEAALLICKEWSYDEIDYFIYTNTCQFDNSQPFKFMIVEKSDVMDWLSSEDPRLISRQTLLDSCTETVNLSLA